MDETTNHIDDASMKDADSTRDSDTNSEDKSGDFVNPLAGEKSRRRIIFNFWHRDPEGEVLKMENSVFGKQTHSSIQLWGATLNNFFYTNRIPVNPRKHPGWAGNVLTISTSSKLLGWMEKHGEDYAIDDLDEARQEPDPEVIEPFDIGKLIRMQERVAVQHALESTLKELPPVPAIEAPRYPMPWPRPPFSSNKAWPEPPILEKLIPLSCLPKNLIVHDPWGTVDGIRRSRSDKWKAPMKSAKALRYRLQLSKVGEERVQRELDEAKEKQAAEEEVMAKFLADPHTRNTIPKNGLVIFDVEAGMSEWDECEDVAARIFCVLPQNPTVDPNEPAHLRLSPSHYLGSGHHSVLYDAEFEVPRDLLVERPLCRSCILDAAVRIRDEEDAADPTNERVTARGRVSDSGYEGPFRVVHADVGIFKSFDEPCEHFVKTPGGVRHPPTATVRVAAKLSRRHDSHLVTEAMNYEAFPLNFFQHWSGLCIPPRHQFPVPVGAIAPQYYGYYVFDGLVDDDDPVAEGPFSESQTKALEKGKQPSRDSDSDSRGEYYSPILLMENCGKPIESQKLCIDDREQAISLFNRFQLAGWCHLSLFQRNIVVKPGPIDASPSKRLSNSKRGSDQEWSFRLIDYGRSRKYEDEDKDHPCYDKQAMQEMDREKTALWQWLCTGGHPDR